MVNVAKQNPTENRYKFNEKNSLKLAINNREFNQQPTRVITTFDHNLPNWLLFYKDGNWRCTSDQSLCKH